MSEPLYLRRTAAIALVAGTWLTLVDQGGGIIAGGLSFWVLLKVFLNCLTPSW